MLLYESPTSEELRSKLEIKIISEIMRTSSLCCFWLWEKENDQVNHVKHFGVESRVLLGRPKKI